MNRLPLVRGKEIRNLMEVITIDSSTVSPPLRRPWKNAIAVGRAYDLTRTDLRDHLAWLQKMVGFGSCRFHAIFHDDMAVVRRVPDGRLAFQWHQVDLVYDTLLGLGLKPFVELNPMPSAMASGDQVMFDYKMNVTPPRDWQEWYELVRAFAVHLVERYGIDVVRSWNFEVWNEPNLPGFWSGTKEEYFRLYATSAAALKSVDPGLRVGGPASSKAHWLTDLINFCVAGNVPIDFVSTHLYPQDEFVEFPDRASSPYAPGDFFGNVVRQAKEEVLSSALPDLPIHWTEWNTQLAASREDVTWTDNRFVDILAGGSFVVRQMVELDDCADTFCYWVASDIFTESPQPLDPFSHTYGLLTIHGLPKATANAFRFLELLRGKQIAWSAGEALPPFCGLVATQEGDAIRILLWNDVPPDHPGPPWSPEIKIRIPDKSVSQTWIETTRQIRAGAGSPYESWVAMGKSAHLTLSQLAALTAHSEPSASFRNHPAGMGALFLHPVLNANEVVLVELAPLTSRAGIDPTPDSSALEIALGELSRD